MAPAPHRSVDPETPARANSEADETQAMKLLGAESESQLADAPAQTAGSATSLSAGEAGTEEVRGDSLANQVAMPFGLTRPVAALLIVDPKLVPAGLEQERYPTGDLLLRLDDARVSPETAASPPLSRCGWPIAPPTLPSSPAYRPRRRRFDETLKRRQIPWLTRAPLAAATTSSCSTAADSRPDSWH
jgi:hypothetical protein